MSFRTLSSMLGVLVFSLSFGLKVEAQSADRINQTWSGAGASLITRGLRERRTQSRAPAAADVSVVRFKPAGDSGVAKALADALGGSAEEKATLTQAFLQIEQGYAAEVAKEGKSNNLAAAFTFFIVANVMAYGESDTPSDAASEALFGELQVVIARLPEFARLSDAEKQKMHDWLVCMGGFALGSANARQNGDQQGVETYRQLAAYALRLVLGVEASKLSFKADKFLIETENAVAQPSGAAAPSAKPAGQMVVGVWSKSASSPWGLSPGAVVTNAGYYKGQYQFGPNGSYRFKGESWGGSLRSNEFWTIEESGVYSVDGDALTISPRTSTATLRDRAGVVKKTQNNPLEKMTYKWKLHYFEGIGETNLVLQPSQPTMRDGGFAGNSDFPNSYLYSQNGKLEWRF